MKKILKDGVIYLEASEEVEVLKEAIAELQARERARDPKWTPKVDLIEKAKGK